MKYVLIHIVALLLIFGIVFGYHIEKVNYESRFVNTVISNSSINPFTNIIYIDREKINESMFLKILSIQTNVNLSARENFDIYAMLIPYVITIKEVDHYNKWRDKLNIK